MADHQNSGLSAKEFCYRKGLNEKTFSAWKKRLSTSKEDVVIKVESSSSNRSDYFSSPMVVNATLRNGLIAQIECPTHKSFDSTLKVLSSL